MAFAVSSSSPNPHSLLLNPNSPFSIRFLSLNPNPNPNPNPTFPLFFNPRCSSLNASNSQTPIDSEVHNKKPKRKPKPSFYEQIRQKWSAKPVTRTQILPWQMQRSKSDTLLLEPSPEVAGEDASAVLENLQVFEDSEGILGRVLSKSLVSTSLCEESKVRSAQLGNYTKIETNFGERHQNDIELGGNLGIVEDVEISNGMRYNDLISAGDLTNDLRTVEEAETDDEKVLDDVGTRKNSGNDMIIGKEEIEQVRKQTLVSGNGVFGNGKLDETRTRRDEPISECSNQVRTANRLPWISDTDSEERGKMSKTDLAEKMIPEHELKRLRNVALRMKERIKVGAASVTQALVDTIKQKWSIDEVVKLRFEGPSGLNMRRTHEILESKTGGVVIWRSGSSVVLYRGLSYKLGCVETYAREKGVDLNIGEKPILSSLRLPNNLSEQELMEASELNNVLDELGPRYLDWSGRPPLPVDADLLPPVVRGYKTPRRLLPYGTRRSLRDEETTRVRQLARNMPPHFALGRNRELQGLAAAMVKLWEKNAIAKIAIKRGVLNTNNDRIAEELKKLTGGTLLSRNKEYIVFYRGNDFLPPTVTNALNEREQLTMLQYGEEDARRYASTLIISNSIKCKVPMVAGTLAETVAAASRWGNQPNSHDLEKMMKESAISKRASLIKCVHNKYAIANGKFRKAERALEKVQEHLEPGELPTDSEIITDEERLVFRKMGLSMKPYLPLGRREVFDGTIENMHLHWKFRELVKIIVKGKNFAQVKHIAISLEAESGGLLVSVDKTTKGYAVIIYRGKNYQRPLRLKPTNLLTKRQALARSIELQRREALKHHISDLLEQMELLKSELEDMKGGNEIVVETFYEKLDDTSITSNDDRFEDEGEEAYLQVYDSEDEKGVV